LRVVAGANDQISRWVADRIPAMAENPNFGPSTALGVETETGEALAGVVFYNYQPWFKNIEMAVACDTPAWLTQKIASRIMAYPFGQLKVQRVTAITPSDPKASISRFLTRFGFKREGLIRKGLGTDDAVVWGLLESEWRWSRYNAWRPVIHGKANPSAANRSHGGRQRPGRRERRHGAAPVQPQQRQ
jgi:RimJ/RimL family protein N-acetyltransferase